MTYLIATMRQEDLQALRGTKERQRTTMRNVARRCGIQADDPVSMASGLRGASGLTQKKSPKYTRYFWAIVFNKNG
jgi:hypothetical protein